MGNENPIRTLGDYSKPSPEGYRNTIELPVGNNVLAICLNIFEQDPSPHGGLTTRFLAKSSIGKTTKLLLVIKDYLQISPSARTFGSKSKFFMTISIPSHDEPLINQPANHLPQDVSSTSDLPPVIELENQVQRLMEAHLSHITKSENEITPNCEIYSGPHDT
ncbi:hypothetical protein Tco_0703578 [Tanacetum coccineum]|uniref:Kinesin motor domain-containing protein n=1 Tax=Tanacetum coccineum TaxID=301880 RepID=A0ABQ4Y145_9ASTR